MKEFKLTIHLHPSIESEYRLLSNVFKEETKIIDGIISVLKIDENITNLLIINGDIKPGYLLISDKRELKTTGIINEKISSDLDVRIIPISHGG